MNWQWITGPAVGAVIGYITNDIAVRMMFRPHSEKRLFGRRVPFTPGLIPKERPRLARAIRDVLDHDLLNADVIGEALLSPVTQQKLAAAAEVGIQGLLAEERTPRMILEGAFGGEEFALFEGRTKRAVGIFMMEKILESGLEKVAAEAVLQEVKKKVAGTPAAVLSLLLDEKRSASLEEKLAQSLREMLATHAPAAIDEMLDNAVKSGLDTSIGALASQHGETLESARDFLLSHYASIIQKALPAALSALDLGQIVEDKLNALNMQELEALIMQVMKKELRAIVWLGALLGLIMGLANIVFAILM